MGALKRMWNKAFVWICFWRTQPAVLSKPSEKKKRTHDEWTMGKLLDMLDSEHQRFSLKYHKYSTITKNNRRALMRFGPLILPPDQKFFYSPEVWGSEHDEFEHLKGMAPPMQAFIGTHYGDKHHSIYHPDPNEVVQPISMFAIRQGSSAEWGLQRTPGVRYVVGVSFIIESGEEVFFATYATVDFKTGKIYVPKMHRREPVRLPSGYSYTRPTFAIPNAHLFTNTKGQGDAEGYIRAVLASLLYVWSTRDSYYQVSTRKGKGRVTFCVHPGEQVKFFKDRDKTAIAVDGKRKRIVHYVQEHERITPTKTTTVREHLRGIRKFTWGGYSVAVTVPKFHLTSYSFSVAPMHADEVPEHEWGHSMLSEKKVATILADEEDNREYQHGKLH